MRAEWLGSAGLTALVRCPCGARIYLPGPRWRRRGFATCDRCKAVIRHGSLRVVEADETEGFLRMAVTRGEEREALREGLELELRRFLRVYATQPPRLWSPATQRLVLAVRPALELLGGPIGLARGDEYGAAPERACPEPDPGGLPDRWSIYGDGRDDELPDVEGAT